MLTKVADVISAGEVARRLREQDLAPVAGGCDPRCPVNVFADVTL
ncbi:MAG TPA: hypothetical protein VJT78_02080 [Candidatus Dormibacteraeota bacterium]|nr:hypothetical protein [Candidatus Dormibacteraeota bacterium]